MIQPVAMNLLLLIAVTVLALFSFCGSAQRYNNNQGAVKGLLSLDEVHGKTGKSPQQWSSDFWTRILSNNADTSPIHGDDYIASKYGNTFDFDGEVSMGEFLFLGGVVCPNGAVTPCESEGVHTRVFSINADIVKYLAFPLINSAHWQAPGEDLPDAALDRCETRASYYTNLRGVVVATAKVDGETLPGLNGDPTTNLKDYYIPPPFDDDSIMYVDVKVHSNPILGTDKGNSTLKDELVCTHGFFVFLSLEDYAYEPDINIYFKADLYNPEDLTEHWFGLEIDYTISLEREEPPQDPNQSTATRGGAGGRRPSSGQPREDGRVAEPRLNSRRSSHTTELLP